jgi:hypothetical protein
MANNGEDENEDEPCGIRRHFAMMEEYILGLFRKIAEGVSKGGE